MGLCRQPPNRIGALTAARLLRRLAQINSLKPETAQLLIARLQQEDTFGRPVQAVMQDAEPLLSKLVRWPHGCIQPPHAVGSASFSAQKRPWRSLGRTASELLFLLRLMSFCAD